MARRSPRPRSPRRSRSAPEPAAGACWCRAGMFLTGAIHLMSNVELHVSEGATLQFDTESGELSHRVHALGGHGAHELLAAHLCAAAEEHRDHRQGHARRAGQREELVAVEGPLGRHDALRLEGGHAGPAAGAQHAVPDGRGRACRSRSACSATAHYLRPPFIQPYECENVLIADVRVRNSPFWNIHPVLCKNITLRGVDMYGHGPNNDGVDPESVDHMLIEDCSFDTGDDCIAVNSGRNADGRRLATCPRRTSWCATAA